MNGQTFPQILASEEKAVTKTGLTLLGAFGVKVNLATDGVEVDKADIHHQSMHLLPGLIVFLKHRYYIILHLVGFPQHQCTSL